MSSRESLPRIIQLANTISASAAKLQEALSARNISSPTFEEDASHLIPPEASEDHDTILDATAELHDLLLEPLNLIHRHCGHNNPVCMLAITTFNMASMVPSNGKISFGDMAKQTPMTEEVTTRLLRHAMTMRIFQEPEPGMVAHTAASKVLANPGANDWLRSGTEEMWPAATKAIIQMVEALQRWPASQEPNETGYSLTNDSRTLYDVFAQDADRAARWGRGPARVVFSGHGNEHIALALASKFCHLSVVVQSSPQVAAGLTIPEALQARVQAMPHNSFDAQPVKNADVYFLRWCLHNWSDKYCLLMLRALVPALKGKARLVIQETIMPEPGTGPLWKEKNTRATDINMAAAFNGRERTAVELEALVEEADARFSLERVIEPPGSALGILEFVWSGEASQ